MSPTCWKLEHGTVLRDDDIETRQITGHLTQIRQTSSGHEDHDDATSPRLADGLSNLGVEESIRGDRAVVVQRKGGKFHSSRLSRVRCRFSGNMPPQASICACQTNV